MKFSVITPSLNSEKYIERAILSVLSQDYADIEHIVVDAESCDGTIEILKKYPHLHWISESDSGQSEAMNKGLSMATGDIIVYLNADDYFLPRVFHAVAREFEDGADFVLGDLRVISNNGNEWESQPSTDFMDILMHWKGLFPLNPVQYFLRRSLHEGLSYNVDNHLSMDHEFLIALFARATPVKLDMIFGVFDMVDGSKTAEALKNPAGYWSHERFSHVDRFLMQLSAKEAIDFKNQQYDFFRAQQLKRNIQGVIALRKEVNRSKNIVIYGAGTQLEVMHEFFADKITHVVDSNPELQGKTVLGYEIQPPATLSELKAPVIVVSAFGYRDEIAATLQPLTDGTVIFAEDFFR